MKTIKCFFVCVLILNQFIFADSNRYAEKRLIVARTEKYLFVHRHDWSESTIKKRRKMFFGDQNPFSRKNDYSWIECVDVDSNRVLFTKPVPALTYLYVSPDSRFIIGLSNIKFLNPVQMVVFNSSGDMLFNTQITSQEVKMTMEEFFTFKTKHSETVKRLSSLKRLYENNEHVYINFSMIKGIRQKTWLYLFNWISRSHLSKNFSESVTNFIDWYKEPDPEIQLKYENEKLTVVSLLDPAGERFEIKIK